MPEIPTVTGPVSSDKLGIVLMHEYLFYGLPGWQYATDVTYDRATAFEQLCSALKEFKQMGGTTIVDASGITLGRNVTIFNELSQATGVQIIATTGFGDQPTSIPGHFSAYASLYRKSSDPHMYHWHRDIPGHFFPSHGATKEYLMFLFYNELTEGMAAPGMIRTKMLAGMVKTAGSWNEITPTEDNSIRGAAMAARKAGASVYTDCIKQAKRQMEMLSEESLGPECVIVGGCDDSRAINLERDKAIAGGGSYVAYDHIGWEDARYPGAVPDERRVELVKEMVKAGFTSRVILSCSAIGYAMGTKNPGHSFVHLLKSFVPRLKQAGVSEAAINTMLVENPARVLSGNKK